MIHILISIVLQYIYEWLFGFIRHTGISYMNGATVLGFIIVHVGCLQIGLEITKISFAN